MATILNMNTMDVIPTKSSIQFEREQFRRQSNVPQLWALLDEVKDPEIPVLSLWDIGILKDISHDENTVTVIITPTYSGCPAMDIIREDIEAILHNNAIEHVKVTFELTPAWTTDWMTSKGRDQLRGYGIAPPDDVINPLVGKRVGDLPHLAHDIEITQDTQVTCPRCCSHDTRLISEFASTACKALFQCNDCNEPFDLFKHI